MYAARDRPLPLGAAREFFPFLSALITVFMSLFRVGIGPIHSGIINMLFVCVAVGVMAVGVVTIV